MKTRHILKAASFLLILTALLAVFSISVFALDPLENDPSVKLTSSLSHAGNGASEITGSGELHSTVLNTTINFCAASTDNHARLHLRITFNGETTEVKDKYYFWVCSSEEDYGKITVEILDETDKVIDMRTYAKLIWSNKKEAAMKDKKAKINIVAPQQPTDS